MTNATTAGRKPRAYIAGDFGFSEAGRHYYKTVYLPALTEVVDAVDPWSLTDPAEVAQEEANGRARQFAFAIGERNAIAIRGCELLIANLDGQEPDAGTVAEVGFAAGLDLRCYGIRSDFRESGERGAKVNLQVEYFILASGGFIADSLEQLISHLRSSSHPGEQRQSPAEATASPG